MIKIGSETEVCGFVVFEDHLKPNVYYVIPKVPTIRLDDNKKPVFKFIRYRNSQKEKINGGFAIFDVEFTLTDEERKNVINGLIKQGKANPEIGTFTVKEAKASLNLESISNELVEKVYNPGSPSLYGNFVTPFTVELSEEGATLFDNVMQSGEGGTVQVAYNLMTEVYVPSVTVEGRWSAKASKRYAKEITEDKEYDSGWGVKSKDVKSEIIETIRKYDDAYSLKIDFTSAELSENLKNEIRTNIQRIFDERIADAIKQSSGSKEDSDSSKDPNDIFNIFADIDYNMIATCNDEVEVYLKYIESAAILWDLAPRGTLLDVKAYDPDHYKDYFVDANTESDFFKKMDVDINVSGDFKALGIDLINLHIEYTGKNQDTKDYTFKDNDTYKFKAFIENNNRKYKYWYEVFYKNEARTFKSEEIVNDSTLTINLNDLGVLNAKVEAPPIIDFGKIAMITVSINYEDKDNEGSFEEYIILDKNKKTGSLVKPVFKRNPKYKYSVKYTLSDGNEYSTDLKENRNLDSISIDYPFKKPQFMIEQTLGDFGSDISKIYLDLSYEDVEQNFSHCDSIELNSDSPFINWEDFLIPHKKNKINAKISWNGLVYDCDKKRQPIKGESLVEKTSKTIFIDNNVSMKEKLEKPPIVNPEKTL